MSIQHLQTATDNLGYLHSQGEGSGYLFLNGRELAMEDGFPLQEALFDFFSEHEVAFTMFDYGGWGKSAQGDARDKTKFDLPRFLQNTLDILDHTTAKDEAQVLVGYSLGVYLALAAALLRPEKVLGIVGLAPSLAAYVKETGYNFIPNPDGKPLYDVVLDKELETHVKLKEKLKINVPLRLLHGTDDKVAHFQNSLNLMDMVDVEAMELTLLKGGNHFLKRDEDIEAICKLFL